MTPGDEASLVTIAVVGGSGRIGASFLRHVLPARKGGARSNDRHRVRRQTQLRPTLAIEQRGKSALSPYTCFADTPHIRTTPATSLLSADFRHECGEPAGIDPAVPPSRKEGLDIEASSWGASTAAGEEHPAATIPRLYSWMRLMPEHSLARTRVKARR